MRKFGLKKRIKVEILSLLGWFFILFLGKTIRLRVVGEENLKKVKKRGSFIYAFWHGRQFLLVYKHRGEGISVLSSLSLDGEIQARVLSRLGCRIVRGSSSRRSVGGILELRKEIEKGNPIALAVDGPKGPGFKVKEGVVFLAQKTGVPLLPLTGYAHPAKFFSRAWDNYLLPYPFSRGVIVYGKPFEPKNLEKGKKRLQKVLEELEERAKNLLQSNK